MINTDYEHGERILWYKDLNRHRLNKVPAIFLGVSPTGRARIAVLSADGKDGVKRVAVDFDNISKVKVSND